MSGQSAHEGGKVVSHTHRPPLPTREDPWYLFMLEIESITWHWCRRKKKIESIKNFNDPSGIKLATFRLAAFLLFCQIITESGTHRQILLKLPLRNFMKIRAREPPRSVQL